MKRDYEKGLYSGTTRGFLRSVLGVLTMAHVQLGFVLV